MTVSGNQIGQSDCIDPLVVTGGRFYEMMFDIGVRVF